MYGGFSGGFEDHGWACLNPLRTFAGPVGGLRSALQVDKHQLRPYYHVKKKYPRPLPIHKSPLLYSLSFRVSLSA